MQSNFWPILKEKLALQLGFVALLIYTVLLPFQPFFPPITSGIVAFWLVYVLSFKKERLSLIFKNYYAILWILYYLLLIIGLIYTSNSSEASKDIVLKISLLLWPLGFATWPELILKYKTAILTVFSYTTVASAFALISIGIANWLDAGADSSQLYRFMSIWDWLPNHYIALYSSFSIFILIHNYLQKLQKLSFTIIGISILILLIALTSVRIQFIALPLAAVAFIFLQDLSKKLKRRFAFISVLGIAGILFIAFLLPSSRNRLTETIDEIRSINGMVDSKQTNHRVFLWKYGAEVVNDNLWAGTGTGSADNALNEKLKDCPAKFWNGTRTYTLSEKQYNYHNAYLQQFATHGIFGFLLLIVIFLSPFFYSAKKINGLEAAFLILCAVSFFTESMLERQAGVLFFGFFYSLFFTSSLTGAKSSSGK